MQQCCIKRFIIVSTWTMNDEDRQSHTESSTGSGLCWNLALPHRKVTVKQTALFIGLLLTSGSHCLKEVPASVLEILPIKVKFNQNLKETQGPILIHPHVGELFQPCLTQCVVDPSIFKQVALFLQANSFLLYGWWIMSGLLLKWEESPFRSLQENIL